MQEQHLLPSSGRRLRQQLALDSSWPSVAHDERDEEAETEHDLQQATSVRHDMLRLRAVVHVCVCLSAVVLLIGVVVFRVGGSSFEKRTSTIDLDSTIVKVGRSSRHQSTLHAEEAFDAWDRDGSGAIETEEFKHVVKGLNPDFSDWRLDNIVRIIDTNSNGIIVYEEFGNWIIAGSPMMSEDVESSAEGSVESSEDGGNKVVLLQPQVGVSALFQSAWDSMKTTVSTGANTAAGMLSGGGFSKLAANLPFLGSTSSTTTTTTTSTSLWQPWYWEATTITTTTSTTSMPSTATVTTSTSTSTLTQMASMFCWSVVRAHSYEVPLITQQYWRKASIFECDEYAVYSHGGPAEVGPLVVVTIDAQSVGVGNVHEAGTTTSSWLNTMIFMRAWQLVLESGKWWANDWTVKVDPDAVFFPRRLKVKLYDYYPAGEVNGPAWYVANCDRSWNGEPWSLKVFGSFEVYSRNALGMYNAHQQQCKDELNWKGWGEDYFMQKCMQKMGVKVINGVSFLADKRCYPAECSDTSKVTFHDYKDEYSWFGCWDKSRAAEARIDSEAIFLQKK